MESKQLAAQEQSGLEKPKADKFEENLSREVPGSDVEDSEPINSNASSVITDEVLRHRIRALIDEKPRPSILRAVSAHPLVVVVVGGLIGVALTQYYTSLQKDLEYNRSVQQQELGRQRSFSDEVNKTRVQKLGEVWEQLDKDESTIDRLLDDAEFEGPNKDSSFNNKRVDDIRRLINDDQVMASRYRFWLGEDLFHKTTGYLDINVKYALNKLTAPRGTNLRELIKKREDAKQNILQIRSLFLDGEPNPQVRRVDK